VNSPKAYEVASVPETIESLARPVEVPMVELRVVEVALNAGTSRYEERARARAWMSPVYVVVPVPVYVGVPLTKRLPVTVRSLLTLDEARETKPPTRVERPLMAKVDEAPIAP